jgi:hypothetical protein
MRGNDPIKKLIDLARGGKSTSPASLSQRVRGRLQEIEEALSLGVPRADLAQALEMSLGQFAQALYRARRMQRAGGDRRQPNPTRAPQTAAAAPQPPAPEKKPAPAPAPSGPSRPTGFDGAGNF